MKVRETEEMIMAVKEDSNKMSTRMAWENQLRQKERSSNLWTYSRAVCLLKIETKIEIGSLAKGSNNIKNLTLRK